jgi:hypothetical protein
LDVDITQFASIDKIAGFLCRKEPAVQEIHQVSPAENRFAPAKVGKYDATHKGDNDPYDPANDSITHRRRAKQRLATNRREKP